MSIRVIKIKKFNSPFENEIQDNRPQTNETPESMENETENMDNNMDNMESEESMESVNEPVNDNENQNENQSAEPDQTVIIETPFSKYVGVILEDDDDKPFIVLKGYKTTVFDVITDVKICILKSIEIILQNLTNQISKEEAIQKLAELENEVDSSNQSEGVYLIKRNQIISIETL